MTPDLTELIGHLDQRQNCWHRFAIEFSYDAEIPVLVIVKELDDIIALIKELPPDDQTKRRVTRGIRRRPRK